MDVIVMKPDIKILEKNLLLLDKKQAGASDLLKNISLTVADTKPVIVEVGRKGALTMQASDDRGSFYLHSVYHPELEAELFVQQELTDDSHNVIVVVGFGLGYLPQALCKNLSDNVTIVIVEPRSDIAHSALSSRSFDTLLKDVRIKFVLQTDVNAVVTSVVSELNFESLKAWKILITPAMMRLHHGFLKVFVDQLGAAMSAKMTSFSTSLNLSELFIRNGLANTKLSAKSPGVKHFIDCWKGRPAIIVAAGPSLNKQLDQLREIQGKILIIAVDKTWPILSASGIKPDIVVAIDPRRPRSWQDAAPKDVWFLVDIGCNPDVVNSVTGGHIFTHSSAAHEEIFGFFYGERGIMTSGGSVATHGFAFAKKMGASPIILIGQDLAYTGGASHASGYLWPKTLDEAQQTMGGTMREVAGFNGGRVFTNSQLDTFRSWFEAVIKEMPLGSVINATEGGARIAGAKQLSFKEACRLHTDESPINLDSLWPDVNKFKAVEEELVQEKLVEIKYQISAYRRLVKEAAEISKKLLHTKKESRSANRMNAQLGKIEQRIFSRKNVGKLLLQEFVQATVFTTIRNTKLSKREGDEHLGVSVSFYEGLVEGCDKIINFI